MSKRIAAMVLSVLLLAMIKVVFVVTTGLKWDADFEAGALSTGAFFWPEIRSWYRTFLG